MLAAALNPPLRDHRAGGGLPATRHSPGERRSAAEDAVPRLVNRASLHSNETAPSYGGGGTGRGERPPHAPPPSPRDTPLPVPPAGDAPRPPAAPQKTPHQGGSGAGAPKSAVLGGGPGSARSSAGSRVCKHADCGGSLERLQLHREHRAAAGGLEAPTAPRRGAPRPPRGLQPGSEGCPDGGDHRGPAWHAPLTGSVLRAVSGVRGVAAGQPAGCCCCCCRSSAGCVSRASCRSRM